GLDEMGVQGRGARARIDLGLDGWEAEQWQRNPLLPAQDEGRGHGRHAGSGAGCELDYSTPRSPRLWHASAGPLRWCEPRVDACGTSTAAALHPCNGRFQVRTPFCSPGEVGRGRSDVTFSPHTFRALRTRWANPSGRRTSFAIDALFAIDPFPACVARQS